MSLSFKQWMCQKGYKQINQVWTYNNFFVTGKKLSDLLNEYKKLKK